MLTGEHRRYNPATAAFDAPPVAKPFDPRKSSWGAWEATARYSVADLNHATQSSLVAERVRGGRQEVWAAGLNWYPNSTVKFMIDYNHIDVERMNAAGLPLDQVVQTLNLRSQFAF